MNDPYTNLTSNLQDPGSKPPGRQFENRRVDRRVDRQPHQLSSASSYEDLQYLFGVQDPAMITPKSTKNRRKPPSADHVKHRRTRSGCYTCRNRRVKCDENHPTCERCKKGNRECVYPEPVVASKTGSSAWTTKPATNPTKGSPASSSNTDYDEEENEDTDRVDRLESIPDEDETTDYAQRPRSTSKPGQRRVNPPQATNRKNSSNRQASETPSLVQDKGTSPTPSTEGSVGYAANLKLSSEDSGELLNDWSHLPNDLQYYLRYFYDNITHHHYFLKHDSGDFLRTLFLDAALRNDALLHAVVGFSAFQMTLHNPEGRIQDFLQYYNKAVSLLLISLKRGDKHSISTLLAILQLATIEEYLGDWINLLGHQKAAFEILTSIFDPQTVLQTELSRVVLGWYARFDVMAGLMAGYETVLPREWFSNILDFFHEQSLKEPDNLNWKLEAACADIRLIAMDMSIVFSRMGKGETSFERFMMDNEMVSQRLSDWYEKMDPALRDTKYLVADFSGARKLRDDDIVDPYTSGILYQGPLWTINLCMIDWYSIDLMHRYQTAMTLQQQPSMELGMKSYACCQLFEAIEFWPQSPKGSVVGCQAGLGIASLFLPRDEKHNMWCRRKLATIETEGYIYPLTFRVKMSGLFQDQDCMNWWLPNEEGLPLVVRSIRNFVEERTAPARDVPTEDLRDMKAIFSSMKLDDSPSSAPSSNPTSSSGKGKGSETDVTIASDSGWSVPGSDIDLANTSGSETYAANPDDGQGYWSQAQNSFGLPKQDR